MEDNPYSMLIRTIRKDISSQMPATFRMGKVLSTSPLKIEVSGTVQEAASLLKNEMLSFFWPGETVLLFPIEDEQRYIIICKVVNS